MIGVLMRKGNLDTDTHREETICRYQKKTTIYKLRRKAIEENNLNDTFTSDLQPQEL